MYWVIFRLFIDKLCQTLNKTNTITITNFCRVFYLQDNEDCYQTMVKKVKSVIPKTGLELVDKTIANVESNLGNSQSSFTVDFHY